MGSEWRNYHFRLKNREMSDDKPPTSHSHVSMHSLSLQTLMFEALGTSIMHKIKGVMAVLFAFAFCFAKTAPPRTQAGLIHCVVKDAIPAACPFLAGAVVMGLLFMS